MSHEKFPSKPNQSGSPATESGHEESTDPCQEIDALMAAFAMGVTDPEETALVHARLAACPDAVASLAAYTALTEALLHNTPTLAAPARLEAKLRRTLEAAPTSPTSKISRSNTGWLTGWRWSALWRGAAIAAILVLLALNLFLIHQQQQLRQAYEQLVALQSLQAQQEDAVYRLLASTGRQAFELPPAQDASSATAEVLWDPALNVGLLYARSFPNLPPEQAYQLWMTADGVRESGGLFTVDDRGAGLLLFTITRPLDQLDSMGITNEPAAGSPGPTGSPVVRRQFSGS